MRKLLLFIVASISLITSCIEEDFVDDLVLFDPKLKITTGSSLGQDSLFVGDTIVYMAEYFNNLNELEEVNFTWISSEPEVASVSEDGQVIALSKGVANLEVSAQGLKLERLLIIDQQERVEIQASASSALVGEEIDFSANYYNRTGILSPANFSWISSDAAVASIDPNGKLTGLTSGQTSVTASTNGITSHSLLITIVNDTNSVASIDINAPSNFLLTGETKAFTATVRNINGNVIINPSISWASNNTSVLTINSNGMATGISQGMADITASADGINSSPFSIMVADDTNSVVSIDIDTSGVGTVLTGGTALLTATPRNVNGTPLMNQTINWSSSNLSVLTVDNVGLITGVGPGASDVTASSGGVTSAAVNLIVKQPTVTSRTGSFTGRGSYRVSGDVTVTKQSDGSIKVDLESNFSTSSGPGLYVYLSNSTSGGLDIGKLKSNSGSQTYTPPANVSINDYDYVLIWCKPFGVTFGQAKLN